MKKDLHNRDEVAVGLSNVEGIDHVDNDDKVTIAIVDQHQEGIRCFFHNMKSTLLNVSEISNNYVLLTYLVCFLRWH